MLIYVFEFFAVLVLVLLCLWYFRYMSFYRYLRHLPQVRQLPLIGCSVEFPSTTVMYTRLLELEKEHGPIFWGMGRAGPVLFVAEPKLIEIILTSPKYVHKPRLYRLLQNWLGLGLLNSGGEMWKRHRKIITRTFHFKILEQFTDTFNSAGDVLVEKLAEELKSDAADVFPYMSLCALDIVCETAMGTCVNAQNSADSVYVQSVKEVCRIVMERQLRLVENLDITYQFTENYRKERTAVKAIHDFTNFVIRERRAALSNKAVIEVERETAGSKKKMVFLDLLPSRSNNEELFSDEEIGAEVETFMFGGHDTVSTALSFTLHLLANNPEVQEKALVEIKSLLSGDRGRATTFEDLREMKYLELVIKESLRLYAPVPVFMRKLRENLEYEDKILPKGVTIFIMPYVMQRSPKYYKDPEVFNPERFLLHNTQTQNTFSYIPFSAGPRNCIGQKYAMLVMKSILSKVLRNFEFLPVKYELKFALDLVLKSEFGVKIKLKKRDW